MPIQVTTLNTLIFGRRGDPDPAVKIDDEYDPPLPMGVVDEFDMLQRYSHTRMVLGPVAIDMYGDRPRTMRFLTNLQTVIAEYLQDQPRQQRRDKKAPQAK